MHFLVSVYYSNVKLPKWGLLRIMSEPRQTHLNFMKSLLNTMSKDCFPFSLLSIMAVALITRIHIVSLYEKTSLLKWYYWLQAIVHLEAKYTHDWHFRFACLLEGKKSHADLLYFLETPLRYTHQNTVPQNCYVIAIRNNGISFPGFSVTYNKQIVSQLLGQGFTICLSRRNPWKKVLNLWEPLK